MVEWLADEEFHHTILGMPLHSTSERKDYILQQFERSSNPFTSDLYLIIETKEGLPIGISILHDINWRNRNLNFSIGIGEKGSRNKMFGVDAFFTTVIFAFDELNMHKVIGGVYGFNKASMRIAERGGAKREAILRKHIYKKGEYHDMYLYGFLRNEYSQLIKSVKETYLKDNINHGR